MDPADIRYLYAYDRWATEKVLDQLDGINSNVWGAVGVVGDRGLGSTGKLPDPLRGDGGD